MTTEELMQPRYEVIADYPNSKFEVGSIFNQHFFETSIYGNYMYVTNTESPLQGGILKKEFAETMPHLFRKLEWWQKRDVKDMPEYVKCINGETSLNYLEICKPILWGLFPDEGENLGNEGHPFAQIELAEDTNTHDKGELVNIHVKWLIPSTETEFLNFKNNL